MPQPSLPRFAGFGLGMRTEHYDAYLNGAAPVDFVEIISENFMGDGGRPLHTLEQVRQNYPVAMHGVSMSIGSADGLKADYLSRLKRLADRIDPLWVSDHLCWTGVDGFNSHDLLPLPYSREALDIACGNVALAQDLLARPLLIENPSSYIHYLDDAMTEWEFLAELTRRTGCYLLLDINNVYVSATNHGFDPVAYIQGIPVDRVRQIHLAGHSAGHDGLLIDTHDHPVPDPVWSLYAAAMPQLGDVAVMIERDDDIPPLEVLLDELAVARRLAAPDESLAA